MSEKHLSLNGYEITNLVIVAAYLFVIFAEKWRIMKMESEIQTGRSQSYIFKRYIWLMSLLYDYKRLSFEEISQKWMRSSVNQDDDRKPLPKRTFHAHIEAISDIFGVIITNEGKGDYKYYIENIEDLDKGGLRSWILSNFSMSNALADSFDIRDRIILQDIPSSKRWLSTIITAIREKKVIEVEYHSFQKGQIPTMRLYPFFVKLYDNRWYMYAHSEYAGEMNHYALDRIDSILVLDEKFELEPTEKESFDVENCFGHNIDSKEKAQWIRIKAIGSAPDYLDTLPLHHTQEVEERGSDYVVYKYFFAPTTEFYANLCKWGRQLEVLK